MDISLQSIFGKEATEFLVDFSKDYPNVRNTIQSILNNPNVPPATKEKLSTTLQKADKFYNVLQKLLAINNLLNK